MCAHRFHCHRFSHPVHFSYPNEREYSIVVESTTTNGSQEKKLFETQTKTRIQEEFQMMIRRLLVMTQTFTPLPRERFLILRLHYRKDTPSSYEPTGFEPASSGMYSIFLRSFDNFFSASSSQSSQNSTEKIPIGELKTPYHSVSMKYYYLPYFPHSTLEFTVQRTE